MKQKLIFLTLLFISYASAEPVATPSFSPSVALPASGVLSESSSTNYGAAHVAMPWAEGASKEANVAPLSGSVFKKNERQWSAKVFNNSKTDSFNASVRVVQKNASGAKVKSDFFSVNLAPGQSSERTISSFPSAMNATLELQSWKKTFSIVVEKKLQEDTLVGK